MSGTTKYKVGDVFYEKRKIVEYCGSHPKWRVSMWKWECLGCGTIHGPSMTATLTRKDREGAMPSCCHPRTRKGSDSPRWNGFEEITGSFLNSYKHGAKKRGLKWQITPEQLWDLWITQDGKCAYTGRKLKHGTDASIDRIDNKRGYLPDNVQWVHRDINRMKSDFDAAYFIQLCKEVANNVR